ncbi:hypothetical protein [Bordetella genomosp. 1]|uniref:Uncharacterized protein n=1 Tax=Bordetella genomosp. 1 TaxID=1395607 RepID=A0ABX4EXD4_9BORD|nr:hypothetical protein [Bordetella genomosp. 1]MDQ8033523.1 hypothetical protein [Bordetella sp.]OZI63757.1 hypothetical protein CAL27_14200 [Bordetella genomosp. 1]
MRVLACLALCAFGAAAQAREVACPDAARIVRAAYPEAYAPHDDKVEMVAGSMISLEGDGALDVVCRAWPSYPDLIVALVPIVADFAPNGRRDADLDVLLLDRKGFEVRARHLMTGVLSEDTIMISALALDTAAYEVRPGERAFGVRITRRAMSRTNPYSETSLRLFLPQGEALLPVLDGLIVDQERGEWDGRCQGWIEEHYVMLAVGRRQPDGWNALDLRDQRSRREMAVTAEGECRDVVDTTRQVPFVMRHQDAGYVRPDSLRSRDSLPPE